MRARRLGGSELLITPIGFGAWAMGGSGWSFPWGAQDDADSIAAIHEALDLGDNWIDTAAVYGLGHSEEVVARALDGVRNRPFVFTKCARVWNEPREIGRSLKAASIRRECEGLPAPAARRYDRPLSGSSARTRRRRRSGLSDARGSSARRQGPLDRRLELQRRPDEARANDRADRVPAAQYSLLHREVEEEILPFCEREGIGVIAYSPMASDLLTGAIESANRDANFSMISAKQ
jgi:aryl-alcohol dehydrogenase-like predicted oxidoreductase